VFELGRHIKLEKKDPSYAQWKSDKRSAWVGHTLRGESLLKTVIEDKMLGQRFRGRPRPMMLDWMMVERL